MLHVLRVAVAPDHEAAHPIELDRLFPAVAHHHFGARLFGVAEVMDGRGGRGDAGREDVRPEERVHERGLPVVELTDDHEMEAILFELLHQLAIEPFFESGRTEGARDIGELLECEGDIELPLAKAFERAHQATTLMMSWTLLSTSSIEMPPSPRPAALR